MAKTLLLLCVILYKEYTPFIYLRLFNSPKLIFFSNIFEAGNWNLVGQYTQLLTNSSLLFKNHRWHLSRTFLFFCTKLDDIFWNGNEVYLKFYIMKLLYKSIENTFVSSKRNYTLRFSLLEISFKIWVLNPGLFLFAAKKYICKQVHFVVSVFPMNCYLILMFWNRCFSAHIFQHAWHC